MDKWLVATADARAIWHKPVEIRTQVLVVVRIEVERPGNGVYFEGVHDFGLASGGDAALVHQGKDVYFFVN